MAVKNIFFVLCLVLSVVAVNAQVIKPGVCPQSRFGSLGGLGGQQCPLSCSNDFQCPGAQKCCPSAVCGSVCRQVSTTSCANVLCPIGQGCVNTRRGPKCRPLDGRCPFFQCLPRFGGLSPQCPIDQCRSDRQCPRSQICCNRCGCNVCISSLPPQPTCNNVNCPPGEICQLKEVNCFTRPCVPQPTCVPVEKPGFCPMEQFCTNLYTLGRRCNRPQCFVDGDCPRRKKCCRKCKCNVCVRPVQQQQTCRTTSCPPGYRCVQENFRCINPPCYQRLRCVPIIKPGRCPALPCPLFGQSNQLCTVDRCQVDFDCPRNQKCCDRCGCKQCARTRGRTCKNMFCGPGQVCQMKPGFCNNPPCPLRPVCQSSIINPFWNLAANPSAIADAITGRDSS